MDRKGKDMVVQTISFTFGNRREYLMRLICFGFFIFLGLTLATVLVEPASAEEYLEAVVVDPNRGFSIDIPFAVIAGASKVLDGHLNIVPAGGTPTLLLNAAGNAVGVRLSGNLNAGIKETEWIVSYQGAAGALRVVHLWVLDSASTLDTQIVPVAPANVGPGGAFTKVITVNKAGATVKTASSNNVVGIGTVPNPNPGDPSKTDITVTGFAGAGGGTVKLLIDPPGTYYLVTIDISSTYSGASFGLFGFVTLSILLLGISILRLRKNK